MKQFARWLTSFLLCNSYIFAFDDFRTPLQSIRSVHYPLFLPDDGSLVGDTWNGISLRVGDQCFFPTNPNNVSRNVEPLVALFFNKPEFFAEESFPGGTIDVTERPSGIPQLSLAEIKPLFGYFEIAAFFAARIYERVGASRKWFVGGRTTIMMKSAGGQRPPLVQFPIGDIIVRRQEELTGPNNVEANTYRLDYASMLTNPTTNAPVVVYGTPTADTTIGGSSIVGDVDVVRSIDKRATSVTTPLAAAASGTVLNAAGTNGANGDRLTFAGATDYVNNLGQNRNAQQALFLVPDTNGGGTGLLSDALVAQNAIEESINFLEQTGFDSVQNFFASKGVFFQDESFSQYGLTDWEIDVLAGYHPEDCYVELGLGLRLPSGRTVKNPGFVTKIPADSNGHVTVKGSIEGGVHPIRWLGVRAYLAGAHVFKHTEKRAAPFKGATVKNIGPTIDASVSWNYMIGSVDITIFHPAKPDNMGLNIGYEFYMRGLSDITLKQTTAIDFIGLTKELDANVLRTRTNALAHKLRGEVFLSMGNGGIFAGISRILAGRNCLRATQANIGFEFKY